MRVILYCYLMLDNIHGSKIVRFLVVEKVNVLKQYGLH